MNNKLFLYSLNSIKRRFYRNASISFVFIFIVFILFSVLFIKSSLQYELDINLEGMPELTLQKMQGGRTVLVEQNRVEYLQKIQGVSEVIPRTWGYYFFEPAQANFVIVGFEPFGGNFHNSLRKVIDNLKEDELLNKNAMIVGSGVKELVKKSTGNNYISFISNNLVINKVPIISTFNIKSSIFTNDVILMPLALSKKILEIPKNKASDIIIRVINPNEIKTVIKKINELYSDFRIITRTNLKTSYKSIFNYSAGIFLVLFIIVLFSFFILVYDKASGLSENEKTEISILKAIGWKSTDILYIKSLENIIISIFSFLWGFVFAYIFIYVFNAPLLKEIFLGYSNIYSDFNLVFKLDFSIIFTVFFLSVCIYLSAVLIPTYKCAVIDAEEALR